MKTRNCLAAGALWFCVVALGATGCGKGGQPAASGSGTTQTKGAMSPEQAKKEAAEIFANRCTPCHGPSGAGDGPASAGLAPKPRDFRDPEWQKSVDDAHIEKAIQYGGAAVGKSAAMPANPDLNEKTEVVASLRALIRGLGNAGK